MLNATSLVITGLFSIITAGMSYIAATRKFHATTKDNDKTIYISAVTKERAIWRGELREFIAKYCEIVRTACNEKVDIGKMQYVKTQILLRLNPHSMEADGAVDHKYDYEIINTCQTIFEIFFLEKPHENIDNLVIQLEKSTQYLLKQEWDKSKGEAKAEQKQFAQESNVESTRHDKLNNALKHLLYIDKNELRLKLIFDYVRNYGIAASVIVSGIYLFKHGTTVIPWSGSGVSFGILFILLGLVLSVLNFMIPIYIMVEKKVNLLIYFIVGIITFMGANELVWGIINRI